MESSTNERHQAKQQVLNADESDIIINIITAKHNHRRLSSSVVLFVGLQGSSSVCKAAVFGATPPQFWKRSLPDDTPSLPEENMVIEVH